MKKIYSFLAAALLLSTTLWAQNVATVTKTADGTLVGEYATMATALAAWTDNTTLTMLDNATYDATATYTVAGAQTLNLAGKTLTWNVDGTKKVNAITISGGQLTIKDDTKAGKLNFLFTNMSIAKYGIYQTTPSKATTTETLSVENVTIECDMQASNSYTASSLATMAVYIYKGSVSMENSTILMKSSCAYGMRVYSGANLEKFDDNTIRYEGNTASQLAVNSFVGLDLYQCASVVPINNATIDMTKVPAKYDKYNSSTKKYVETNISGAYGLYARGSSTYKGYTITIAGGKYSTPTSITGSSYAVYLFNNYVPLKIQSGTFEGKNSVDAKNGGVEIEGGRFNPSPNYQYAKEGFLFEKQADGFYSLVEGTPFAVNVTKGLTYTTEESLWAEVSTSGTTAVELYADAITIPKGKNVSLRFHDNAQNYNVVNNGTMTVQLQPDGDINVTNNGTLNLNKVPTKSIKVTMGETSVMSVDVGAYEMAGKLTFTNPSTTDLSIRVLSGKYTPEEYERYVKGHVPNTYKEYHTDATKTMWQVLSDVKVMATVDGIPYTLAGAVRASSEEYPAILTRSITVSDFKTMLELSDGKHHVLDMNGKTITCFKSSNPAIKISHGTLDIIGQGTIIRTQSTPTNKGQFMFQIKGTASDNGADYSVLNIGENVTIEHDYESYMFAIGGGGNDAKACFGAKLDFAGMAKCALYFASINGTFGETKGNVPVINITPTAEITCKQGIYAAGYAKWTFAGNMNTEDFGFEIRAGELAMTGGSLVSTATAPADDQFNGNGSTSQACGIAVCQHSTQLPVTVTIDGGEIKAYTPLYQANPMGNPQEAIDKVSVTVNDAKVYSTSKNIVWSANKKITLNGGVYNINPSAYAADGKVVVANKGADAATYPWTIGNKKDGVTFQTEGDWNTAANWSDNTIGSAETPVTIAENVTISGKAEAYGITVNVGKTITIEKGGVLVVGKDGISGITAADQLTIKDGGALVVSPVAATAATQPLATAEIETTIRDVQSDYAAGNATYPYIWKNVALPVQGGYTLAPKNTLTVNKWQNGWVAASEFNTPFAGYHITIYPSNPQPNATYTFTGNLNGNVDVDLTMPTRGFHLFGNSWSAPLDVREILNQIEHFTDSKVNASIKVYISDNCTLGGKQYFDGTYVDITRAALSADAAFADVFGTLGAHECFFLENTASSATVSLNYEKAVWNAMLATSAKSSAPKRMAAADADEEPATRVEILLTADNARWDNVLLYEGEAFGATKMLNEGTANVNIYATTVAGNYSTVGAESLLGTELAIRTNGRSAYTLSFDKVQGEVLYIKDLQTGITTEMSEGNTYTFTAEPNTTSKRFRIVSRSEVTTGVEDMSTTETTTNLQGIYSVTGQYLGTADQLSTLPAGVYIINGKKVVK